jgi:hypothetical protein
MTNNDSNEKKREGTRRIKTQRRTRRGPLWFPIQAHWFLTRAGQKRLGDPILKTLFQRSVNPDVERDQD